MRPNQEGKVIRRPIEGFCQTVDPDFDDVASEVERYRESIALFGRLPSSCLSAFARSYATPEYASDRGRTKSSVRPERNIRSTQAERAQLEYEHDRADRQRRQDDLADREWVAEGARRERLVWKSNPVPHECVFSIARGEARSQIEFRSLGKVQSRQWGECFVYTSGGAQFMEPIANCDVIERS
jgi:hypothetical protein